MNKKIILYPLVLFGTALVIAFSASLFLTVSFDDVLFQKRHVNADRLNAPWPGKAYAFYKPTGQFVATPLCTLDMAGATIDKTSVTFSAENTVGQQFSEALGYVMKVAGIKGDATYDVQAVSLILPMEKSFSTRGQAPFMQYCWSEVEGKVIDPDYVVYQVENAYLDFNEASGHNEWKMVSFKPKPIILVKCEPGSRDNPTDCDFERLDYREANWVTRVKHALGLISIS